MRKSPVKLETLIGTTINYLTLLELAKPRYVKSERGRAKQSIWRCRCICGEEKLISHGNIISGNIKSCGCKRKELTRNAIEAYYTANNKTPVESRLFEGYRYGTAGSKRAFHLTFEQFYKLVNSNCKYCGLSPFTMRGNRTKSRTKALHGIDRVDSSKDYTLENSVTCCVHCNRAKMDRPVNDFLEWIKLVYKYQNQ